MPLRSLLTALGSDVQLVDPHVDLDATTIEWAHVSEMIDPTRWLRGGELLLLTGLMLPVDDPSAMHAYVTRLRATNIAALGISTGASLAHLAVPSTLADAAIAAGLPLLSIAEAVPLESVVETVAAHSYQEQIAVARSTARTQRELSRLLFHGAAPEELLRVIEAEFGVAALVCTPAGRTLFSPPGADTEARRMLTDYAMTAAAQTAGTLHAASTDHGPIELHAIELQDQFIGGYLALAASNPVTAALREALPLLLSAVARALLPPLTGDSHHLAWRTESARWVFASPGPDADIDARLAAAGYRDTLVRAAIISGDFTPEVGRNLARYYFETQCDALLAHPRSRRVDCLLLNPAATLRVDHGVRGISIALGSVTAQASVSRTLRAAAAAVARPSSKHTSLQQLMVTVTAEDRAAFAHAVLGELITAPHELLATLRAYLDSLGAIEAAAAQLSVHRHTVRHRLTRISEISGRDPDDPSARMHFSLALAILDETVDVAPEPP